jgi:hypothetical protein
MPLIALSQARTDHRQVCWQTAQDADMRAAQVVTDRI